MVPMHTFSQLFLWEPILHFVYLRYAQIFKAVVGRIWVLYWETTEKSGREQGFIYKKHIRISPPYVSSTLRSAANIDMSDGLHEPIIEIISRLFSNEQGTVSEIKKISYRGRRSHLETDILTEHFNHWLRVAVEFLHEFHSNTTLKS